jgi:hypothetical protein
MKQRPRGTPLSGRTPPVLSHCTGGYPLPYGAASFFFSSAHLAVRFAVRIQCRCVHMSMCTVFGVACCPCDPSHHHHTSYKTHATCGSWPMGYFRQIRWIKYQVSSCKLDMKLRTSDFGLGTSGFGDPLVLNLYRYEHTTRSFGPFEAVRRLGAKGVKPLVGCKPAQS